MVKNCGYSVSEHGVLLGKEGYRVPGGRIFLPKTVTKKLVCPKPSENLWMFCDSKLIGITKAKTYQISENDISGNLIPTFDIDQGVIPIGFKNSLRSPIYVSVPSNLPKNQRPQEVKSQSISNEEIKNILDQLKNNDVEDFDGNILMIGGGDIKIYSKERVSHKPVTQNTKSWVNKAQVVSAVSFTDSTFSFLNLVIPYTNGSHSDQKKILICKVGGKLFIKENCYFDQLFKVMKKNYAVLKYLFPSKTGGTSEETYIYQIINNHFVAFYCPWCC